jgi:iron complex outermembrane receptor protein
MAQAQQEAKADSPQAQPETAKLEAVVVTSNKRKEKLMEVPAAVTVMDSATLTRAQVKDLDDLPNLSPALTITYSDQPGNYSINMRGIGTFSLGIGVEADVSVIMDDIPLAMQASSFRDLADVARVEVLKGPQSTLYGKSSIAGALNISTTPIQDEFKTTATALLTNDGENRLGVSVSGALNDKFRMRVAASHTNFDGTLTNLSNGTHLNGSQGKTLLGKLEWAPTDNLTFTLSPHYDHSVKNCCMQPFASMTPGGQFAATNAGIVSNPALPANLVLGGIQPGPGNVTVRQDYPAGGISRDVGAGLKIDYQPEGGVLVGHILTSITSFDKYHLHDFRDGDGTDWNLAPYMVPSAGQTMPAGYTGGMYQYGEFDVKSVTQELRLTSPDKQRLRYVAGLWYGKNNLERYLWRGPVGTYAKNFDATAFNTTYAAFANGTFDITDKTSLIAGLRRNKEDTGYTFTKYTDPGFTPATPGHWAKDDSETTTSGRLGLEHRLNNDVMFYGVYSTGHKGKAYDLTSSFDATVAANMPVPGEKARNYELGMKASLLDNRAAVSVAVFKTNFFGFQQSASVQDPDGTFRTQLHSIGQLETSGVEVDGSFRVSKSLLLTGNLAYMRAIIVDFPQGPCYDVSNAAGTGTVKGPGCAANPAFNNAFVQNLAGKTLPNAPKLKFNIGGQYDFALPSQSFDLFFTGNYRWQKATQFSLNQDPNTIQGDYGILDGGLGVKDKKGVYKLSFFGKNLLNQRYAAGLAYSARNGNWSVPGQANISTLMWTPPRDYTRYFGARLDLSF